MRALIVGGGQVGSHLAAYLLREGHQVGVVEHRPQVLARLHRELPTEAIVDGDGTRMGVLEMAGVRSSDVLVAVTGDDEVNLVVVMIARLLFNVPRAIARVNNPRNAWLFTAMAGVDVALNQAELLSRLIVEQMSLGDVMTLLRLRQGELALVTEKLQAGSRADGRRIAELDLPQGCLLTAVIRGTDVLIPHGETVLQAGDEVLAVVRVDLETPLGALLANSANRHHK